jgi:hypothetical protein
MKFPSPDTLTRFGYRTMAVGAGILLLSLAAAPDHSLSARAFPLFGAALWGIGIFIHLFVRIRSLIDSERD